MVPVPDAVKAEIARGGSEKRDYRNHKRIDRTIRKCAFYSILPLVYSPLRANLGGIHPGKGASICPQKIENETPSHLLLSDVKE
jgi:hypothetical protein